MRKLLASLAVLVVLVALFLVRRDTDEEMSAGLSREPIAPAIESGHAPTELDPVVESAAVAAKTIVEPEIETAATRSDASGRTPWKLSVNVSGFTTPLVEGGVPLSVSALGDDAVYHVVVEGDGKYELDVTGISREQLFDSPSLNVLVDHAEFFLWDEVIDGRVENGCAFFEADIVLEPFRAGLAGRVTTPPGHRENVSVGVFQIDADTGLPDRSPIVLEACAADGSFDIRVEDPGECFLVAHSERLRPDTLRLTLVPGTMRDGLVLNLDRGSSITGWVTVEGEPLAEKSSVTARAAAAETEQGVAVLSQGFRFDPNSSWTFGTERFRFDETKERFENLDETAVATVGGAFTITGLERVEYDITISPYSDTILPTHVMATALEGGRFHAPAHGVRIDHSTAEVRLEFRRGGEIVKGVNFGVRYSSGLNRVSVARVNLVTGTPVDTIRLPEGRKTTLFIWGHGNNYPRDFEVDPGQADANGVVVVELPEENDE